MTRIPFTKGHGTQNDFVLVPDHDGTLDLSVDDVAFLCDRRAGIGGDGMIRVVRTAAVPEVAALAGEAEWFMDYRNADGSAAEMCGNGIRVYAKYLVETGRATIDDGPLRIGTRAGTKTLTRSELGFEVDLGLFAVAPDEAVVRARGLDVARPGQGIDVGNPHVVVALSSVAELDDLDLTVQPQLHPLPAAGANIEFVVPAEPLVQAGVGTIRMRVFERGVGETLSCGTGCCAVAVALHEWVGPQAPTSYRLLVPGGEIGVHVGADPWADGTTVLLTGPAEGPSEARAGPEAGERSARDGDAHALPRGRRPAPDRGGADRLAQAEAGHVDVDRLPPAGCRHVGLVPDPDVPVLGELCEVAPGLQDGLHPAPGLFLFVAAHEQVQAAGDGVR